MLLVKVLQRRGYHILMAATPEEALIHCDTYAGLIDVLLTDVVMPGIGGRKLAERVQQLRPGIQVVFMSGYTVDAIAKHGVLEEGTAFIEKPFTPNALIDMLQSVIGTNPPAPESM